MDDPLMLTFVGVVFYFFVLAFVSSRKTSMGKRSKWRKQAATSLWVVNAMMFGGASSPVEKGQIVNVRKRNDDDDDDDGHMYRID